MKIKASEMSYFNCLFYLTSDNTELVEIQRLDLAEGLPKSHVYKWLFIENGVVNEFTFESMKKIDSQESREFKEATLVFDQTSGLLNINGREIKLERKDTDMISYELRARITNYLK